jgi:hypothetical protein
MLLLICFQVFSTWSAWNDRSMVKSCLPACFTRKPIERCETWCWAPRKINRTNLITPHWRHLVFFFKSSGFFHTGK